MRDVFVFADEAGNFDFSTKNGASKYFILGTVTMTDPSIGARLIELRRELAMDGLGLETHFHATQDKQLVRDQVFALLAGGGFRADFTIFEKRKTVPHRQTEAGLYKLAWYEHMKHIAPGIMRPRDRVLVVASSLGTKKKLRTMRLAVEDVVDQTAPTVDWQVAAWSCATDPCLQIADYCTWAVQRKWEQGDDRSYVLIESSVITEFDYFRWGRTYYY